MKNFVQEAKSITVPAPAGGVVGDQGFLLATGVFVVAKQAAAAGADVDVQLVGAFDFPKATGALSVGQLAYWDDVNKVVTSTPTGNTKIGIFIAAAASNATRGRVRLNGTF